MKTISEETEVFVLDKELTRRMGSRRSNVLLTVPSRPFARRRIGREEVFSGYDTTISRVPHNRRCGSFDIPKAFSPSRKKKKEKEQYIVRDKSFLTTRLHIITILVYFRII